MFWQALMDISRIDVPLLGTLQQGAPADIIAVKGNLAYNQKILEYADLVISDG